MSIFAKSTALFVAALLFSYVPFAYASGGSADEKKAGPHAGAEDQGRPEIVSGKVLETMNSGGYTYIYLETSGGSIWVAIPTSKVKVGEELALYAGEFMYNFTSKGLKRTFDKIMFSSGAVRLPGTKAEKGLAPAEKGKPAAAAVPGIKVDKASGPGAYTVAEIYKNKASLSGKEVTVKGKVTKVSVGIMNKNWVHVQDGTGNAAKGTHDLIATTDAEPAMDDVVTVTGTLATDKDFGYGYKYDVIIEKAAIKK